MNTLRLYAFLSCFALLIQSSVAQAPPTDPPPPLDVNAICAESPTLCVLAQRVQQIENKAVVEPTCYTVAGGYQWCAGDPWPPDCGPGYEWRPSGCEPVIILRDYAERATAINTTDLTYYWPVWWPRPWDIPRPPYPYPWQFGPLPDPWQELALQHRLSVALPNMATPGASQLAPPVLIGTDKGPEPIPDFCLKAEWAEGQIPPECSGLAGLVRKLGLSPEDSPLLQAAP